MPFAVPIGRSHKAHNTRYACGVGGDNAKRYLTVRETARRLNAHENTVRNWVRQGVLDSARVPGTRFHRFDEEVVERLRQQRGAVVSSAEPGRRTFGPELVDGTQLSQWAGTRDAHDTFPELIRRLLAATPGITNVSVRAGEGVAAPGWDGRADSVGTAFLPTGRLFFEFGVGRDPKAKADADWEKRKADPLDAVAADSLFVFITPRRWSSRAEWEAARRQEGVFADVRALDADDLEGWLQTIPAIHQWISEELGRNPRGAETLEHWWGRFRARTQPPLPTQLFLAGRDQEGERLTEQLRGAPAIITVQAAWRDEALAFVWAAIARLEAPETVQPPVIVSSDDVWARVVEQPGRMTLLPLFDAPDIARAHERGHHVVLVTGRDEVATGTVIRLPRPHRQAAGEALQAAGIDSDRTYRLAALARRSMPALVRTLARDPRVARPAWARPPGSDILAPLALLGAWTASDADRAVAARMTGTSWEAIERSLAHWIVTDDPPFVRSATEWHLASPEQAFLVLRDVFTSADLARWRGIAADVLLAHDPVAELPTEERSVAALRGVESSHSGVLRAGVAQAAAVVGSLEDAVLADGATGSDHARAVVRHALAAANAEGSGRTWRSLSDVLPRLAEAAPAAFLDAVHDDLDGDEPLLSSMFQDRDQSSWLHSSSPHTGLLWALETLCWSPEFIVDAARALARLHQIDPGGRLSNRPIESLQSVLVGWIRHTSAPLATRVQVLDAIAARMPDVGWPLLLRLWPETHAVSSPPSAPHFRDWAPESRNVSIGECIEYIGHLVRLALELAGEDPERWAELVEHLGPLPPSDRERVLQGLDQAASLDVLGYDDRLMLWERIHKEVARHRRFAQAEWSMSDDSLSRLQSIADRLEPTDRVERFAYLFDWHPDLPDVDLDDYAAYETRLLSLRVAAIEETLRSGASEALRELAQRSPVPSHFGLTLGGVSPDDLDAELFQWLDADREELREAGASWASRKLHDRGVEWLQRALAAPGMTPARRAALVVGAPATSDMWQVIEGDPELAWIYWERMNPWRVEAREAEYAARRLLAHDRAWAAVDLLAMDRYRGSSTAETSVTPELVREVLDAALGCNPTAARSQSLGYELGQLLDYLEERDTSTEQLAKYEFLFFRLLENGSRRRPRALFRAMASDPGLFVDLLKRVYRGAGEPKRQLSEDDAALARHAWWVLHHWRELPGARDDGTVDGDHLARWVREARLALAEAERADIGDEEVGRVLAASPPGMDRVWPAEPVRDLIDSIGSRHLETGLHVGRVNDRGITSRGVYEGGDPERALAAQYREWSRLTATRWPRTSRVLRKLAENYELDARREDARAEISADTE